MRYKLISHQWTRWTLEGEVEHRPPASSPLTALSFYPSLAFFVSMSSSVKIFSPSCLFTHLPSVFFTQTCPNMLSSVKIVSPPRLLTHFVFLLKPISISGSYHIQHYPVNIISLPCRTRLNLRLSPLSCFLSKLRVVSSVSWRYSGCICD